MSTCRELLCLHCLLFEHLDGKDHYLKVQLAGLLFGIVVPNQFEALQEEDIGEQEDPKSCVLQEKGDSEAWKGGLCIVCCRSSSYVGICKLSPGYSWWGEPCVHGRLFAATLTDFLEVLQHKFVDLIIRNICKISMVIKLFPCSYRHICEKEFRFRFMEHWRI